MTAAATAETPSCPTSERRVSALSAMALAPPRRGWGRRAALRSGFRGSGGCRCGGCRCGLSLLCGDLGVLEDRLQLERDHVLVLDARDQVHLAEPALGAVLGLGLPAVLAGVGQVAHEVGHRGEAAALALE